MSTLAEPTASAQAGADPADLAGLGRRSVLGFIGAFVSGIGTIVTILIANRGLPQSGTGAFFVAISVFSIAQGIATLGLDTGLQYFVPMVRSQLARRLLASTALTSLAAGTVIAGAVWWQADRLARLLRSGDSVAATGTIADVLRGVAVLLPVAGIYEVLLAGLRSNDEIRQAIWVDRLLRPVAQVGAMLGVANAHGSATAMFMAWAAPFVMGAVLAAGMLAIRPQRRRSSADGVITAGVFWRYTGPRTVARIAQVLTQRVDVLLLAGLATVEQAGVYGTVSRCMIAGVFVATAIQQVVQPRLRRQVLSGNHDSVRTTYIASTTWLVLATWPVYLLMAVFAAPVLSFFGRPAENGATSLTILCTTMLVASACGLVDVVLLMIGKSLASTAFVLLALALNISINLIAIPRFGMRGAAVAWAVAILTTNVGPMLLVARRGLHPWGPPLRTAVMVALAGVLVPGVAVRGLLGTSRVALAAASLASFASIAALVVVTRRTLLLKDLGRGLRGPGGRQSDRAKR